MPDQLFTVPTCSVPVLGSTSNFPVRRIYCVGRNYAEHVREMGGDEREPPFFFQKPTDAVVLDGSEVPYPRITSDFQHEVELVLAIGKEGSDISAETAADHVFALAAGIDLTRRDVQVAARKSGRPWEIGKAFDHSAPIGVLNPLDGQALPTKGAIGLEVNNSLRQSGDISQMVWNSAEIIAQLSRQYHLIPGDLIYTGTPAGVGPIQTGDHVRAWVEAIGEVQITIGPAA